MPTACGKVLLSAACLVLATATARAQSDAAALPSGGDPALACKQKPDGRAYWVEYGFCDLPVKGPARAKGLVLWSHGVSADNEQYKGAPPPIMRRLETAGWDVIKINRNNLYERGWSSSGVRHRDDAIERARAAKAAGYRNVILAGQSYGGAISLEANARAPGVDGVVALSPGHGSDAASGATSYGDRYRNLNQYLLDAVAAQKGGRIVVLVAPDDAYHPNRSIGSGFGAQLRAALATTRRPFVVFDETGPIHGHGAGGTRQFSAWFGDCLVSFLDPAEQVGPGETVCKAPDPLPRFMLPANLKRPSPGTQGPPRWLGAWEGTYGNGGTYHRDLMIVVEAVTGTMATVVYSAGAGPAKDLTMGYDRYTSARLSGNSIVIDRGGNRTITLVLSDDGKSMEFSHKTANQPPLTGSLARAD
jgi:pimeloyl-ACP methyl ester carboxylesterase